MSKHAAKPVNMDVPTRQRRRRRRQQVIGGTPPAQLDHATSSRKRRQGRRGERWLAAEGQRREITVEEDTDDDLEQWSA